jgi:hypothetical protein
MFGELSDVKLILQRVFSIRDLLFEWLLLVTLGVNLQVLPVFLAVYTFGHALA